ncbi:MAG: hypothetical protein RBU27_01000 [Bacteroidota bacterium]|jgi:hypothetical protein|nr:hypothetical protein [Bacteroidota bacterium]
MKQFALLVFLTMMLSGPVAAQGIVTAVPEDIDPAALYVFYLPDEIVTPANPEPRHPDHGVYQYLQIANQLMTRGFVVVTRPRETTEHPYLVAEDIARQIRRLLDAGVPATNIGILGAGQGAAITVLVTTQLRDPGLQVVVLSLCTESFIDFWIAHNETLCGNVLSIHADGDKDRGPCHRYLEHGATAHVREHREMRIAGNAGFQFRASAEWLLPAIEWLRGNHAAVTETGLKPPEVRKPE